MTSRVNTPVAIKNGPISGNNNELEDTQDNIKNTSLHRRGNQQQQQQHFQYNSDNDDEDQVIHSNATIAASSTYSLQIPGLNKSLPLPQSLPKCNGKKIVSMTFFSLLFLVSWDALMRDPADRFIKPDFAEQFLYWVQEHPSQGLLAFLFVIALGVITMIPIGTPLTVGCGYVYKGAYGWKLGVALATIISMGGSAIGAITCFLLGRYLMRDQVRQWIRKYPLFDAIDAAAAEHGLRIMAMLYLTPILPLGPVSYMCGTTSMALSSFVIAKIASLPLMLLYVFIGASTGALLGGSGSTNSNADAGAIRIANGQDAAAQQQQHHMSEQVQHIEENNQLIVSGILLSMFMIAGITHYIKKELNLILERQKKAKGADPPGASDGDLDDNAVEEGAALEMGNTTNVSKTTAPRYRRQAG